jgi:hypothetical protein
VAMQGPFKTEPSLVAPSPFWQLLLHWLIKSVPGSRFILERKGLVIPEDLQSDTDSLLGFKIT